MVGRAFCGRTGEHIQMVSRELKTAWMRARKCRFGWRSVRREHFLQKVKWIRRGPCQQPEQHEASR